MWQRLHVGHGSRYQFRRPWARSSSRRDEGVPRRRARRRRRRPHDRATASSWCSSGPSGCGKTTLLRSIGGLEKVTGGRILIGERDVTRARAGRPRPRDGLPELRALPAHDGARRTSATGCASARRPKRRARRSASHEVAQLLGLEELLDRRPGQLSGGQQQRVAMGRAIVREPQAFLMDEPLSNLDAKLRVDDAHVAAAAARAARHDDRLRHARPGRGDDARPARRRHARRQAPAGRRAADALRRARRTPSSPPSSARPSMNLVARDARRRLRHVRRLHGPARPRAPAALRRERPRDRRHPPGGVRGRRLRAARAARDRRARSQVLEELGSDAYLFFAARRRAGPRRGRDVRPEGGRRRRSSPTSDEQSALRRARRPAHERARRASTVRLALDPSRLYFFSPETGETLLDATPRAVAALIRHPEYTRRAPRAGLGAAAAARASRDLRPSTSCSSRRPVDRISYDEAQRLDYRPAALGERFGPLWATYWFRVRGDRAGGQWRGRARRPALGLRHRGDALARRPRRRQGLNTATTLDAALVERRGRRRARRARRSSSRATGSSAGRTRRSS